jgi:hypothetical protein
MSNHMKSQAFLASLCIILAIGFLTSLIGSASGLTMAQINLSSKGTITHPQYSHIIYQQDSLYYAQNGNGNVVASSKDFSIVFNYTLNNGARIFLRNGVYYPLTTFTSNIISNVTVVGESLGGCIIDFSRVKTGLDDIYLPMGKYAAFVIRGSGVNIESLTFRNYGGAVLGLGECGTNVPSYNDIVRNIQFVNCSDSGVNFFDGSGSLIDNIRGDNPYNIVCFWNGSESNIQLSDIYMEPTLTTVGKSGHVDDTVSFNPVIGVNVSNIVVNNVVGNYTDVVGKTNFTIGGVLDFAGGNTLPNSWGNQSWNNLDVSNIYGYYAPAIFIGYDFVGLTNSNFQDIHSSYVQNGGTQNGVFVKPRLSNANISISNVVFSDIFVDHAYGCGFNFLVMSNAVPSAGITAKTTGITLENLYLTNNNQANSSFQLNTWGNGGLGIGNQGYGKSSINGLQITNLNAIDDQQSPTQQYPIIFWNNGAAGTTFTNVQISGGTFSGNVNNVIGQVGNQGGVNAIFS